MSNQLTNAPPSSVTDAVLVASEPVPEGTQKVSGVDFERFKGRDITVAELVDNMRYTGFQSSAVADATRIINDMVPLSPGNSLAYHLLIVVVVHSVPTVILKPVTKLRYSSATPRT